MKSKWFALAILLIVPAVATPETKIASCEVRMLVHPGRVFDGVKIEHDTVEFMIPCLDKEFCSEVGQQGNDHTDSAYATAQKRRQRNHVRG